MDAASIIAAYKRYARYYDFIFGCILNPGRRRVVENINCLPGQKILEVGVGTGLSLPLYPEHTTVVGIDVSPHMLARAHKRISSNGLRKGALSLMDAQVMSFADGSFDKVVAMYVATVVPNPQAMISEMKRVCKPGGDLLFVNHFSDGKRLTKAYEALFSPLAGKIGFRPGFSMNEFISNSSLNIVDIKSVNAFGYWTLIHAING